MSLYRILIRPNKTSLSLPRHLSQTDQERRTNAQIICSWLFSFRFFFVIPILISKLPGSFFSLSNSLIHWLWNVDRHIGCGSLLDGMVCGVMPVLVTEWSIADERKRRNVKKSVAAPIFGELQRFFFHFHNQYFSLRFSKTFELKNV